MFQSKSVGDDQFSGPSRWAMTYFWQEVGRRWSGGIHCSNTSEFRRGYVRAQEAFTGAVQVNDSEFVVAVVQQVFKLRNGLWSWCEVFGDPTNHKQIMPSLFFNNFAAFNNLAFKFQDFQRWPILLVSYTAKASRRITMFPLDFTGINTFLSPIISKVLSESFQLLSFVVLLSLLILAILFSYDYG